MNAQPRLPPTLVLASASPRRRTLLEMLGLTFEVVPAHIDETFDPAEPAAVHAERLAREKARVIAAGMPDAIVIGSDTVVTIDDTILGKPEDEDHALRMLGILSGRVHTVATGVAVASGGSMYSGVEVVEVKFRQFDRETAHAYVGTGEPMDKAGAYGIQGYGATLVERINGDYFAVMGLPIVRLLGLLEDAGWRYTYRGMIPVR